MSNICFVFFSFRPKITFNSGYSPKLWLNFLLHAWFWKIDFPEELNIRAEYSEVDRKDPSVFLPWALLLLLSHQVPLGISVYFTTISACISGFASGWRWEHLQGRMSCQSCCWLWYLTQRQRPSVKGDYSFFHFCLLERISLDLLSGNIPLALTSEGGRAMRMLHCGVTMVCSDVPK